MRPILPRMCLAVRLAARHRNEFPDLPFEAGRCTLGWTPQFNITRLLPESVQFLRRRCRGRLLLCEQRDLRNLLFQSLSSELPVLAVPKFQVIANTDQGDFLL
jgi:hypothetical protein